VANLFVSYAGEKMSNARGSNKDVFIHPYQLQRMANIARNQNKVDELKLRHRKEALQESIQPRKEAI
jgi:hypothetical protein